MPWARRRSAARSIRPAAETDRSRTASGNNRWSAAGIQVILALSRGSWLLIRLVEFSSPLPRHLDPLHGCRMAAEEPDHEGSRRRVAAVVADQLLLRLDEGRGLFGQLQGRAVGLPFEFPADEVLYRHGQPHAQLDQQQDERYPCRIERAGQGTTGGRRAQDQCQQPEAEQGAACP